MKRFLTLSFLVILGLIFTIPVSAQSGGIVSVRFAPGRFNCDGAGEIIVDVAYDSNTPAWVGVYTGITSRRQVTADRVSVALATSSEGAVFGAGASRAMRVIVRFGPAMDSSAYDIRGYWFQCSTGNLLTSEITLRNDSFRIPERYPTTIWVLGNDTSQLSWSDVDIHRQGSNGVVTRHPNRLHLIYTPNPGFIGYDTFEYKACNIGGVCRSASVTVNVYDLQEPALNSVRLHDTTCGGIGLIDVQIYFAGNTTYLTVISGTTEIIELNTSNTSFQLNQILDIPISSEGVVVGESAVQVRIMYGTSPYDGTYHDQVYWFDCNTGQQFDTAVNAINDSVTAPENFPVTINVSTNDNTNLPFDWAEFSIVTNPARGTATISGDGEITYTYNLSTDFFGTDTLIYEICNVAGECDIANVTVTIIDLPPQTIDNIELVEFACEGAGLVDVTVTYSGGPAVITVITGITSSMDVSDADISSFGSQTFSIPISSDNGGVQGDNVLIINVLYGTAVGDASFDSGVFYFDCETGEIIVPSVDAVDDYEPEMARGLATEVDVLANDVSRLPLDLSTFVLTSVPHVGTAEIVNGVVLYTGDGITIGITSFTYEICNSEGFCDEALVELNLVNLAPVCGGSSEIFIEVWPPNHRMVPIHIGGVYDPDGDPITYTLVSVTVYEDSRSWNQDTTEIDFDTENGLIRAERSGNGNGRIYAVQYIASDPDGLSCDGFAYIFVPHDQSDHGSAYPEFDANGNPFPAVPNENGNSRNNGNGNANGNNNPPVNNPPVANPPSNTDTSGDGHNNGLGNDNNNGNAQGDPQRGNNNGNGNNSPAVNPPSNTDTSSDGHNNGLGNDNNNGNAQGDPQRGNNNGNGNATGNQTRQ